MAPRLAALLGLAILLSVLARTTRAQSSNVMTWKVDLDQPPAQRWPWADMIPYYGAAILEAKGLISDFVPGPLQGVVEKIAVDYIDRLGDYGQEISSGAALFNFSLGQAILLNYIYEAEAGCTSIIARQPSGQLIHGRNLDFNLVNVLQNLTCQVAFYRSGQLLYQATTFAGYVGVLSGVRVNGFSITVDQRQEGLLFQNLLELMLNRNSTGVSIIVRETLENIGDWADAVKELSTQPLIAPVYYIVAGLSGNQGAVITRDRDSAVNVWYLNSSVWYQVETNYDPWLPDPPSDPRRTIAEQALNTVGQANVSAATLFGVLSTPQVLNNATTYTALLVPATGSLMTYRR